LFGCKNNNKETDMKTLWPWILGLLLPTAQLLADEDVDKIPEPTHPRELPTVEVHAWGGGFAGSPVVYWTAGDLYPDTTFRIDAAGASVPYISHGPNEAVDCAILAQQGPPAGCNRDFAAQPVSAIASEDAYRPFQFNSTPEMSNEASLAWNNLTYCYQDVLANPADCEGQYVADLQAGSVRLAEGCQVLCGYVQAAFNQGINEIVTRTTQADSNRTLASWFGGQIAVNAGPFEIQINWVQSLLIPDYFNKSLVALRAQQMCRQFISGWDASHCGPIG
jgi:hypothetical protein